MAGFQPPRGTHDLLPPESERFVQLERLADEIFGAAGYGRIITPMFEDSALFDRGIGEANDVVSKETYRFTDRGGNDLTLRPEGTAPVMRAIVSNHMWDAGLPVKVRYAAAMFRYERPQKGRVRQHHQVGLEAVGSEAPALDAEVISLCHRFLTDARVGEVTLLVNSMGHDECRAAYRHVFVEAISAQRSELSEDSQRRLEKNPLRIWDSKDPADRAILTDAPRLPDHLCDPCAGHLAQVRRYLDEFEIGYEMSPGLVRGFDYYTRTTFEFQSRALDAAQNAVGGGGRYDGLVASIGGPSLPGIGFGIGLERVLLAQQAAGTDDATFAVDCFVVGLREEDIPLAMAFARQVRADGLSSDIAYSTRGLKAQMKHADRIGAHTVALIGAEEAASGSVTLRDMATGEQETIPVREAVQRLKERGTPR
ncbi:MAG: histidine--tRNA ligase [Actinomycetota bacterium]